VGICACAPEKRDAIGTECREKTNPIQQVSALDGFKEMWTGFLGLNPSFSGGTGRQITTGEQFLFLSRTSLLKVKKCPFQSK